MTTQLNLRNSAGALTTAPNTERTAAGRVAPRWAGRAALAALAVAGVVGVYALRDSGPTNEPTTTTPRAEATAGVEPLIIAEEQAFIDGKYSHARTNGDEWCATHIPC